MITCFLRAAGFTSASLPLIYAAFCDTTHKTASVHYLLNVFDRETDRPALHVEERNALYCCSFLNDALVYSHVFFFLT